jgi:hypothetical protein
MVATTFGHLKCGIGELSGHHFGSPRSNKLALQTCTEISDQTLHLVDSDTFLFWLLLNNIINGNTITIQSFSSFFIAKKLEFFFHKKQLKLDKFLHYPQEKISKIQKIQKNCNGLCPKKKQKKKGNFVPKKNLIPSFR